MLPSIVVLDQSVATYDPVHTDKQVLIRPATLIQNMLLVAYDKSSSAYVNLVIEQEVYLFWMVAPKQEANTIKFVVGDTKDDAVVVVEEVLEKPLNLIR